MNFRNFVLDDFQVKAIEFLDQGHSVIVSAATGTGKTLIADYLIDKYMKLNKRIVYTAPIKALSNQKYLEFKGLYGEENVGILTGDVQINPDAQIIIMTTEIYRNMLVSKDEVIETVSYVIFDEIHYFSDIERGTIWEESIIFSADHIRFLCLSATIPNARQFGDWIEEIKGHTVDIVTYDKRAVPLSHNFFDTKLGICTAQELKEESHLSKYPDIDEMYQGRRGKKRRERVEPPKHIDLISDLKEDDKLPAIFFIFSRLATEAKAEELAKRFDFTTPKDKATIATFLSKFIDDEIKTMRQTQKIKWLLSRGIAFHHAGLFPKLKLAVEQLFSQGLIHVLYATETFAVGINMPARSVCFFSLFKFDGINFRYLHSKEYFQLAGRAGRRGIDKEGYVYVMLDRNKDADMDKVIKITEKDIEPIISQFKLSFNTVINLINNHNQEEINMILKSSFDHYVQKSENANVRIMASFNHKVKLLTKMGYVKDGALTEKGLFLKHIYTNELLVGELFTGTRYKNYTEIELFLLLMTIVYEQGGSDYFVFKKGDNLPIGLLNKLSKNEYAIKNIDKMAVRRLALIVRSWYNGAKFEELMKITNYQEGDIIRLFRQAIDLMRQIIHSTEDNELRDKVANLIGKIDRDVVKIEF